MRDIINDAEDLRVTNTNHWGTPSYSDWHNVAVKNRFRWDSIATVPIFGRYVTPTTYASMDAKLKIPEYHLIRKSDPMIQSFGKSPPGLWWPIDHRYGMTADIYPQPSIPYAVEQRMHGRLQGKILSNQFDLGQTLGELPETIKFVTQKVRQVLDIYNAVRRGNFARALRLVGSPSDKRAVKNFTKAVAARKGGSAWLELQYGWKPLLQDIYNVVDILSEGMKKPVAQVKTTVIDEDFKAPLAFPYLPTVKAEGEFIRGITGVVRFGVSDPLLYDLNRLGLLNPAALVWELFPLSFVIDWFLHIGNFLKSFTLPMGLVFYSGYTTKFLRTDWTGRDDTTELWYGTPPTHYYKCKAFRRDRLYTFPVAFPYLSWDLGVSQIASLLAIIASHR